MDRTRALGVGQRLAPLLAAVVLLCAVTPAVSSSRARSGERSRTCRVRGSGRLPPLHAVGARDPGARLALVGFEAEVDLGPAGVRPHGRAEVIRGIHVLSPLAFAARLEPGADAPFGMHFDQGYSAFEGMFEVTATVEGTIERWTRTQVVTRLALGESGSVTVTTPCADIRWGAPIDWISPAEGGTEFASRITLRGEVAFRMSASPSSVASFRAESGEETLPGVIVATASRASLVRISDGYLALEGWVPTSRVRAERASSDPALGGLVLEGSPRPTTFEVDPEAAWLDVWLAPGTAVYDQEDATQPIGRVTERIRVLVLHRRGARRAALHSLANDGVSCERHRGRARARCREIVARERTSLLRVSENLRDTTGENGAHVFYIDPPRPDVEPAQ